jgi:Amt family ammonium transporter
MAQSLNRQCDDREASRSGRLRASPQKCNKSAKRGRPLMKKHFNKSVAGIGAILALLPAAANAATSKIDSADTTFMIVCAAFVLMMTLPGLALFYAGMVRKKNVLATMAQSGAALALVSALWMVAAYSLTFHGTGPVIGGLDRVFLSGIDMTSVNPAAGTIPEMLFMIFQMTFAVITCALIGGAVADRMKISAFVLFTTLWLFIVYVPSAHWIWGGGFLQSMGVLDFAGGAVVHINAGVAGLVAAVVLGARQGYGRENMAPFDLSLAVVGTGLLWVGWFGFNGGSALGTGSRAVFAIVATHLAASAGAIVWSALEWYQRGKPSVLGFISGAIAGLGTITPAAGFVLPWHGVVIGVVAAVVCYYACTVLKQKLKYDDSLDVFGIHGIGGMLGMLMVGIFATGMFTATKEMPAGIAGLMSGNAKQLGIQLIGVVVTIVWCVIGTYVALKITQLLAGLRVSSEDERQGLDLSLHGESLHHQ